MTISSNTSFVTYVGNGATTNWSFNFVAGQASWITVYITDLSSGNMTPLAPSQYSIYINPPPTGGLWGIGGTVTYPLAGSPLDSNHEITIARNTPLQQPISIANQGAFYPSAVEQGLDNLELQIQGVSTDADRALKFPLGDVIPNDLPPAAERAGYVLGFDNTGQPAMKPNNDVTITVNTTTQVKDSFSQPALDYLNSPPVSPATGDRYLIGNSPTGSWSGKNGLIAEYDGTIPGWTFSPTPKQGQTVYNKAAKLWYIYRNTWWNKVLSTVAGAMYQDFADVPDGTSTSGLVLASGHILSPTGPGQPGAVVTGGKIVAGSGGNTYNVVDFPYKNIRMGMRYAFQAGHVGSDFAVTLAAGTYQGGAIITKMIHTEYLYQGTGDMSIWGGPRRTIVGGSPLPYLAWQDVQYHYRASDSNYPVTSAPNITYAEMYVNGCNVECHGDSGHFLDSYTDSMISGSLGDDGTGNLGYLYFQQGTASPSSFMPYIYMIFAEPVPATQDVPNPEFIPSTQALPQIITKSQTYGGGTQAVCSFTATDDTLYGFEVETNISAVGTTTGYAQLTAKYFVQVGFFAGAFNLKVDTLLANSLMTENPSVITLGNTFSVTNSGFVVTLNANPTRSGSDTTSTEQTTYTMLNSIGNATFA